MKRVFKILLLITAILSVIAVICLIVAINIMGTKTENQNDFESRHNERNLKQEVFVQESTDTIPQGTFIYGLYFAEWNGRMPNTPVEVIISGDKVIVRKTEETNLSGDDLILESSIKRHKSGTWIITDDESEIYSEEVGGCSGGGIPIDFETKIIEFC